MKTRDIKRPLSSVLPALSALSAFSLPRRSRRFSFASALGLGLLGRRRRQTPTLAVAAAGVALAAVTAALAGPSRRKSLGELLQRSGSGAGRKWFGAAARP